MRPEIAHEVRKAREWLRVCRDLRYAAEVRLRRGGEHHEILQKRQERDAAADRAARAFEDLKGWERLGRTIR
jgi:hypothetical protein